MKEPIWSELAERQTVSLTAITDRISIRRREWIDGQFTQETINDVLIDGYVYTPAVSDAWVAGALGTIKHLVTKKYDQSHIGMGEWINH